MSSLCVFLGSKPGTNQIYGKATQALGWELARHGITCVYGGSYTGLMKILADSVLEAKGTAIGVTVQALKDKENFHPGLTELHVVETMHQRKAMMESLADGFIVLPGGIGTFEEFFEVFTLMHLGFHAKPCGILNINNYFNPLDDLLGMAEREGFLKATLRAKLLRADSPAEMVRMMCERLSA